MNKRRNRKLINTIIRENIIPLIAISVIIVVVLSIVVHVFVVNDAKHEIEITAKSYKNYIEKSLTESINSLWFIKSGIDEFPYLSDKNKYLNNVLSSIAKGNNIFQRIEIIEISGGVIAAAPDTNKYIGADRSESDAFKNMNNSEELVMSTPFASEYSGLISMTVSYKYKDFTIIGYLNFEIISELLFGFERVNREFQVHITNADGVYIYHKNKEYVEQRRIDENFEYISNASNIDRIINDITIDGTDSMAIIEQLAYSKWYMVVSLNKSIMSNKIIFAHTSILLVFLFIILSVYYFSVKRSKLIIKSLNDLALQTKLIAEGNFDMNITEQQFDEFDILVNDFNIMANEIKHKNDELKRIAFTDELTQVLNRNGFDIRINEIILQNEIPRFSILYIDIDNFKNINDTYGHSIGDVLMYELMSRIKSILPVDSVLARIGGDEFIIFIPENNEVMNGENSANSLLGLTSEPFMCLGKELRVTISIGISRYPDDGNTYAPLIQAADIALYNAKDNGKNNYKIFNKKMSDGISANFAIEQALKTALIKNELFLVYQPQVGNDMRIIGFESLLRWQSPQFGLIMPDVFLPIAEVSNDIISIGRWVFDTSCKTIKTINEKYCSNFPVSVNFSSSEILSKDFSEFVIETVNRNGINPHWIQIEITEHMMMKSTLEAIEMLHKLISFGIEIVLDDFGIGYSALSHLGTLPVSVVKIDRSFISDMLVNNKRLKIVESLIDIIHILDKIVIAEGVESLEQFNRLCDMDCDGVQGYYFSKPVKLDSIYEFIDNFTN